MPRPSNNIDKILIKTGLMMLPETGISALNIRELVQRAQVNLGMFHYHFKSKENFVRILMQHIYDDMFASVVHEIDEKASALENLRHIMCTLGKFARDNHRFLNSLLTDLKNGNVISLEFVQENFPRHILLIREYVEKGQKEGSIIPLPLPTLMSYIGAVVLGPPIFAGIGMTLQMPGSAGLQLIIEKEILSDIAIEQRVRLTLKGLSC